MKNFIGSKTSKKFKSQIIVDRSVTQYNFIYIFGFDDGISETRYLSSLYNSRVNSDESSRKAKTDLTLNFLHSTTPSLGHILRPSPRP